MSKPVAEGITEAPAPRSLSQVVYADVRADILDGHYAPSSRLSPRAIAARSNVSVSVVREALTRLTEQGLVVATPQFGFSVVPLDVDDLIDITNVRALVEGSALREAIERSDIEYETLVVATHHRLSRTPYWKDEAAHITTDEWAHAHSLFHSALVSGSPSPRLRELAASLRNTAQRYRRWWDSYTPGRDIAGEHRDLMQAVVDRDADRAVALLTYHLKATTAQLLEHGAGSCATEGLKLRSAAGESAD